MFDSATRRFAITLSLLAVALPLLGWGTFQSARSMFNDPTRWVPPTLPERQDYEWFVEHFELEDAVVLSWPGCTVDDPRLARLEAELRAPADPKLRATCDELFARVLTGYSAVRELTTGSADLSRSLALDRLQGTLVGKDGRTSLAVVVLTPEGARHRKRSIDTVLSAAERAVGLDRSQLFVIGLPVDGHVIDTESIRSLTYFAVPSALIVWLVCCFCLRSWRFTLLVVLVAAVGECLVMTLVYLTGHPMSAVLIVMPPLVFVLTVSGGVHLINYYYDEVRLRGTAGAVRRALASAWAPCLLAATTTAVGLASLGVSDVVPVRIFGVISALGVLATVGLLFLLLPGAMGLWPVEPDRRAGGRSFAEGAADPSLWFPKLPTLVCAHSSAVTLVFLGLTVLSACGLRRLETSVNIRSLFRADSKILRDYRWMEANVGPVVPLEVVVHFDRRSALDPLARLELVHRLQREIAGIAGVGGVTSAATLLPPVPERTWQRTVYQRRLQAHRGELRQRAYLAEEADRESWRISARVPALADIDYGRFLAQLRNRVKVLLAEGGPEEVYGVRVTCTGVMPLVDEAQRALLHDLFISFLLAFVAVTLLMILFLRSLWAGLLAMLPNAFPSIILFGTMGWLGRPVDIGLVMTASVALGIAVDGTLHFLTWYRREIRRQASPPEAVRRCFGHCGRAMVQTTIICGLGMLVFAFSGFVPTRSFAWMMFTLLLAALAGDFVLLPALLVGPLGRTAVRSPRVAPAGESVPECSISRRLPSGLCRPDATVQSLPGKF